MKIVHISAYYIEELAKGYQVYELVREQIADGHEVHIVTSNQNITLKYYEEHFKKISNKEKLYEGIEIAKSGAKIHRLHTSFQFSGRFWWNNFRNILFDLKPDFIIAHNILEFQSLRLLFFQTKLNCPIVFDDHTTINVVRNSLSGKIAYGFFRLFFAKRLYTVAHKIIGISDSCISVLNNKYGLTGNKVVMIPLGTNVEIYFPDEAKRKKYRAGLNLHEDELLIVYTGKIYDQKKVHLIIEALNDHMFNHLKIVIQIVGTVFEEYCFFLQSLINQSKHKVLLTPNVSHAELAMIYNGADIAVWPAHTTTSTLDASACGCPIICSDYKSERYKNGNGIGIRDGNLIDLKNAFKKLVGDKNLRKNMGLKGIDLIRDGHIWGKIAKEFIK